MPQKLIAATVALTLLCLITPCQAEDPAQGIPDLTKGGELTRINKRWVGPVGIHCGAWRARGRSNETPSIRQLLVLEVDKGSPADGVLQVDDVILGADGTGAATVPLFEGSPIWPMIPIAEAITEAEARDPALLKLLIWRQGETKTVTIKLEHLGRYSETAPYDCAKSKTILRKGIKAIYEKNKPDEAGFSVLCLLAADDPTNPDNDTYQARAKEWVYQLEPEGSPWFSGPKLMALSEYFMKTGDKGIYPKLVAQAEHHARGVSWFGTSGHRWSEKQGDGSDNGRIAGYGPITCSGTLGYLGLSLARKAGVTSPAIEKSHEAQRIFFGHYAFKSGMGYGEHPYGIGNDGDDYNGKQAMSGLAVGLDDGGEEKAKYFTRMATLASMDKRQYAHGGSFFGQVFHPIGAAQGGVKAANLQFREIRWHLDLKRRWDHTRIYDSSGNPYDSFDPAATALLMYALPLKQLVITGRGQRESLQFTDAEFEEILAIKTFDPSKATVDELVAALSAGRGMLRTRAADELAKRFEKNPESPEWPGLIDRLIALAAEENQESLGRAGACLALIQIKGTKKEPVASMKNAEIARTMVDLLKDSEAYIRFAGVRVLQAMDPKVVQPHAHEIMDAIVATGRPTFPLDEEDPVQWAHGEMGHLLFTQVLAKDLDGVARAKLIPAIRSVLQTPNGAARSNSSKVLSKLSKEEVLAVADLVVDNIRVSPPANAMFAAAAAANSQDALADHLFEEALPLSATYGVQAAIKNKIPQKYGKAALEMDSAEAFMQAIGDQILIEAVDARAVIEGIAKNEAPKEMPKLKRIDGIKAAKAALKLPDARTELVVDATNFAMRGEADTVYTWRKVYGPGAVSFAPNASAQSKTTTVTFTDKRPGKYRFEVEMSDALALNAVRKTVVVDLYDTSGKMPGNQPPQAKSLSLAAVPGQAVTVALSGSDPDADALGFVVTQMPAHGRLTDVGDRPIGTLAAIDGPLHYTANFGVSGKDRLTFLAIDGQGKTAEGVVEFTVSSDDVGVAVYEGFDYPEGMIHDQSGASSFGFTGPWQASRGAKQGYHVLRSTLENAAGASVSLPTLPSTGGRLAGLRHNTVSRPLDLKVLAANRLLENGGELWFSVFIQKPNLTFELKGPVVSLGFGTKDAKEGVFATLSGKPAGETRSPWSPSAKLRFPEDEPSMIVGRCVWGKTDEDPDRLEIHRVFVAPRFGPLVLENPASVLEEVIDQRTLDSISLNIDSDRVLDEIRIGPTLKSVMLGTKPLD